MCAGRDLVEVAVEKLDHPERAERFAQNISDRPHSGHLPSLVRLQFELGSGAVTAHAIKAEIVDPRARTLAFTAHKAMYGGKLIAIARMAFAIFALSAGSAAA